jgi:hypothetical protein
MQRIRSLAIGLVLFGVVGCAGGPPPPSAEASQALSPSDCGGEVCGARQICCVTPCVAPFCTTRIQCNQIDCAAP